MANVKLTQEQITDAAEAAVIRLISNHRAEFDHLVEEEKRKIREAK